MKTDILTVRIGFSILTFAMLYLAQGLYFAYSSITLALASIFFGSFFFTYCLNPQQLATENYKFSFIQKLTISASLLLTFISFVSIAT